MRIYILTLLLILTLLSLVIHQDYEYENHYGNFSELGSYGIFREQGYFGDGLRGCYDWEPCKASYDFNSLNEEISNLQKRECIDIKGAVIIQERACEVGTSQIVKSSDNEIIVIVKDPVEGFGELGSLLREEGDIYPQGLTILKFDNSGENLIVDIDIQI